MTRLEDMSEPERKSWITFLADGAVFIWFWKAMTGGFGLHPDSFEPKEMGILFIKFIIVTAIVHGTIAAVFDVRKRKSEFQEDERDVEIARKGSHAGYGILQAGIAIILITLILQYIVGETYQGPVSVIEPAEMVFALCILSYIADLYRHGTILWAYRG
jgi:uncharacterized membrane protein